MSVCDQYSDGKAAKVWELYTGSKQSRTDAYRSWILEKFREYGVVTVLDVACGTGVDSIMLVEEGFSVVSLDLSDKMLKYALKERWNRRKEASFDEWVIEEGNWLSLPDDIAGIPNVPKEGFDAIICLGNSFAHLPDITGGQRCHYDAIRNMASCLKTGGILMIDHRNYDAILDTGCAPKGKNVYYPSDHIISIETTTSYQDGVPTSVKLDYTIDMSSILTKDQKRVVRKMSIEEQDDLKRTKFSLSYYPHRLVPFTKMLRSCFGESSSIKTYADFKPITSDYVPAYYIHIAQKSTDKLNGYHNPKVA